MRYASKNVLLVLRKNCSISGIESLLWKAYTAIRSSINTIKMNIFIVLMMGFTIFDLMTLFAVTSVMTISRINISLVTNQGKSICFTTIRKNIDITNVFP